MCVREKKCSILVGKAMHRWEDNIKVGLEGVDWIHLTLNGDQWRSLVIMVMNLRGSRKCWEFLDQLSDC
jgi:hypothetical protein